MIPESTSSDQHKTHHKSSKRRPSPSPKSTPSTAVPTPVKTAKATPTSMGIQEQLRKALISEIEKQRGRQKVLKVLISQEKEYIRVAGKRIRIERYIEEHKGKMEKVFDRWYTEMVLVKERVKEKKKLIEQLEHYNKAKKAQEKEPFVKGQAMFNPLNVKSQNQYYSDLIDELDQQIKAYSGMGDPLSDDTIKHLQDENRKYLHRKIDTQRQRKADLEEKVAHRHQGLARLQDELITLVYARQSKSQAPKIIEFCSAKQQTIPKSEKKSSKEDISHHSGSSRHEERSKTVVSAAELRTKKRSRSPRKDEHHKRDKHERDPPSDKR